MEGTLLVL
jgi:NADH:ubiquinone oxidoreductase subunit H